jgi:hypothetical protein
MRKRGGGGGEMVDALRVCDVSSVIKCRGCTLGVGDVSSVDKCRGFTLEVGDGNLVGICQGCVLSHVSSVGKCRG